MTWDPAIRKEVLKRIAEGESAGQICRDKEMPSIATVMRWLSEDQTFREEYARAKQLGVEKLAEEILDIADDGRNDWMERNDSENKGYVYNGEAARRSQLRIDTRKWILAKLLPKKYGEKVEHEHTGGVTVSLKSEDKTL